MGVNAIDLTTVAAVNNLLSQASGTDSTLIQTEITNLSRYILTKTSRSFLSGIRSYSERYNGNGSNEMLVRNYPILVVSSLSVNGIAIPASPDYIQSGYVIDTTGSICAIAIIGGQNGSAWRGGDDRWGVRPGGWGSYGNAPPLGQAPFRFVQGIQNIAVEYTAGYTNDAVSEAVTVPVTPGPYTVAVANASSFYADAGVTLTDGTPLTPVSGAPGPLQYNPPTYGSVPRGTYTFNAAQQGADLEISYSFGAVPQDLNECATKVVATYYRRPKWLDQTSQMQPGVGTTAFSRSEWAPECMSVIDAYKRRFLD